MLHGALARHRRHPRRHEHRHFCGRTADPDPQISGPGARECDRGRYHPAECPPAEPGHGRFARAGHRGENRRTPLSRAHRALRARRRARSDRRDHGPRRGDGAHAHAHNPRRYLRGRILHGRRRHRHRPESADPRACHSRGRRDDGRPERGIETGARLLQFRHHHRLRLRAGRVQVPDLTHGLSHQRRLIPQPQDYRPARSGDQRGAAGADALVDDLSDDHRGHDLQGAGTRHS